MYNLLKFSNYYLNNQSNRFMLNSIKKKEREYENPLILNVKTVVSKK